MDDLSVNLKECIAGGTIVNHLMFADFLFYFYFFI